MSTASKVVLPIVGMSCSACQIHVEKALLATPGVTSATVSLLANQATVEGTAPIETLIEAVHESGYEALAPTTATVAEEQDESHLPLRAALALAAAVAAMLLSMPLMMATETPDPLLRAVDNLLMPLMPAALMSLPAEPVRWLLLAITAAVMLFTSPETYRRAFAAARHRATNMNTLVAIGTLAAFFYSAVATIAPTAFTSHGLAPDVYFEAVDFILAFLLLGSLLDARAKNRTQSALAAFAKLQPTTARVLRNGTETEIPLEEVQPEDTIQLRPGERVPVDGVVLTGRSTVDESLLTGESQPVLKTPDSAVIGGTINLDGPLTLRATTLGASSVLAQLHRLLAEAQSSRAPMQKLADRASAIFVPSILVLAAVTFALWLAFDHSLPRAFSIAIAVLVIACPCAMGLAVPAALTVGIGRAAQLGILVRNGEALERLASTDTLAFDKTGTLTEGHPSITSADFAPDADPSQLLPLAAALEQYSEHPLASAVIAYAAATATATATPKLADVKTIPGQGIVATHNGQPVAIGNATLLESLHIPLMQQTTPEATTQLHLAVNGTHVLTLQAKDTLRPSAPEAIGQLASLHVSAHMLTGDNPQTAASIAAQCGISPADTHASLLPADKLTVIRSLQQQGRTVAMAGDGLNDAAALAQADTGIAVSTGTDLTREAADLILMSGAAHGEIDLRAIPTAIRLARRTTRTMRQNLGWAVAYNACGLPIAAGLLYPHFHILLSPVLASAAMALSSTSVLLNSLRLRRFH
ncbi:cadmium-translocating P-type ATPase [Granulicella sp. WH15]|uniref:heavy metal translocating P-type ATPase n=1 Tax=Granulicella sp. WH15 TaxID=2602070 RepID=UPI0013676A9B|nr:heavy metal translocating P-type ATPase [Granulicella sp. WH15]QHN03871.1 cadmium-translocating P-type ATPase [Granulicella sp. WH15]